MRHELKYIISPVQYELLKHRLKWVMAPDEHAGENGEYWIRSVYFDSGGRQALWEKQNGLSERKKYRIRCYNGNFEHAVLECKEKNGNRVGKRVYGLTGQQTEALIRVSRREPAWHVDERDWITGQAEGLGREFELLIQNSGWQPVITIDYIREAYVLPLSNLRITFDRELASGPVGAMWEKKRLFPDIMGENMVLEVKYDEFLPSHISQMVASVEPVRTAVSKYVMCMEKQIELYGMENAYEFN